MASKKIKLITFKHEPTFADLWDACLYNLLYNKEDYLNDIISIFKKIKITKRSRILDSSAGTGFISLHLRQKGYNVNCMDLMEDEITVFKRKAKMMGVSWKIIKKSWKDIPETYRNKKYDFIFCRGNSFIYADGGWNSKKKINKRSALRSYKKTLEIFYNQLDKGGFLYIDKFPDDEKPHKDIVAKVKVGNQEVEDLYFYTKKISNIRYREAAMIRRNSKGEESGVPNMTYDLKEKQLESMLKEIGFSFKKINLKSEKHFVIWLAKK